MSELHSLAYASSLHGCSLGCNYHNLGVLNTEMPLVMGEDHIASCLSPLHSDFSSGYLEDAVVEFTSKRRRLLPQDHDTDHEQRLSLIDLDEKSFWNFNPVWHLQPAENFYCMSMNQIESNINGGFSEEQISTIYREEANILAKTKRQEEEEETIASASESPDHSSSSSYKIPFTSTAISAGISRSSEKRRRKRVITRVVYPFAMVKPGGIREGEVTLNEINERILMPPTRPVRHPVGDFACRPCVSAKGHGLSGKAVVALTRIHTQGRRGTITIIRTKG